MERLLVTQPEAVYRKIDGSSYSKIFVVGDIHGQYEKLMRQLNEVEFDREHDLLVSVGDLIDRGPDSLKTLALLHEPWFTAVRGNHEDLASAACEDLEEHSMPLWLYNGGSWILKTKVGPERNAVVRQLVRTTMLPYVIEVKCKDQVVVVVHACYPRDVYEYNAVIDTFRAVWDRDLYNARKAGDSSPTVGADLFVHGHNHNSEIEFYDNHIYIATGAYKEDEPFSIVQIQ